jgi:hypothetical protein
MAFEDKLRQAMYRNLTVGAPLDSGGKNQKKNGLAMDSAAPPLLGADAYTVKDISLKAVAAVQQWCETDDLDPGETFADRLLNMLVGIADANKDGEISDDEQAVMEISLNVAWDYLVAKGVAEEDADALLNDLDADAAERVRDLVCAALPEGEDASMEELNGFVFGEEAEQPALDAVYRKTVAIRGGKKMRVNKRISGKVRLSGKQKLAIRKMHMKSHSAGAMMHRMRSMRIRRKSGL